MVSYALGGYHIDPTVLTKNLTIVAALAVSATALYLMIANSKKQRTSNEPLVSPPDDFPEEDYTTTSEQFRDSIAMATDNLETILNAADTINMAAGRLNLYISDDRNLPCFGSAREYEPSSPCRASSPIRNHTSRSVGVFTEDLPYCSYANSPAVASSHGPYRSICPQNFGCKNEKRCGTHTCAALRKEDARFSDAQTSTETQEDWQRPYEVDGTSLGVREEIDHTEQAHTRLRDDDSSRIFEGYICGRIKERGRAQRLFEERREEDTSTSLQNGCVSGSRNDGMKPREVYTQTTVGEDGGRAQGSRPCEGIVYGKAHNYVEERREAGTNTSPKGNGVAGLWDALYEPCEFLVQSTVRDDSRRKSEGNGNGKAQRSVDGRREQGINTSHIVSGVSGLMVAISNPCEDRIQGKVREECSRPCDGTGYGKAQRYIEESKDEGTSTSLDKIGVSSSKDDGISRPPPAQNHTKVREETSGSPGTAERCVALEGGSRIGPCRGGFEPPREMRNSPKSPQARLQWTKIRPPAYEYLELPGTTTGSSTSPSADPNGGKKFMCSKGLSTQEDLDEHDDCKPCIEGDCEKCISGGCEVCVLDISLSARPKTQVAQLRGGRSDCSSGPSLCDRQVEQYTAEMRQMQQNSVEMSRLQAQQILQKKKVRWTPNTVERSSNNQDYRRRPRSTYHSPLQQRPLTSYAYERPRLQSQAARNTITHAREAVRSSKFHYF